VSCQRYGAEGRAPGLTLSQRRSLFPLDHVADVAFQCDAAVLRQCAILNLGVLLRRQHSLLIVGAIADHDSGQWCRGRGCVSTGSLYRQNWALPIRSSNCRNNLIVEPTTRLPAEQDQYSPVALAPTGRGPGP
jgi:hypothetical protein